MLKLNKYKILDLNVIIINISFKLIHVDYIPNRAICYVFIIFVL